MPLQAAPATAEDFPEWSFEAAPASQSMLPGGQMSATTDPRTGRPLLQVAPAPGSAPARTAEDFPEWQPPQQQEPPSRQVGTGEAAWTGLKSGLTFGFDPAYQGMSEAGTE